MSVDGYVTGPDDRPDDGPGIGLGTGGERLHYEVMGGPWTYGTDPEPGAGICGRRMYDAAGARRGTNPFPGPLVVLTHRMEDQPDPAAGFRFVTGFDQALAVAREQAGGRDVSLGGGADLIRQGLPAGVVDELAISTAPVVLGGGTRLFDGLFYGFDQDLDLDVLDDQRSPYAVHVRSAVRR